MKLDAELGWRESVCICVSSRTWRKAILPELCVLPWNTVASRVCLHGWILWGELSVFWLLRHFKIQENLCLRRVFCICIVSFAFASFAYFAFLSFWGLLCLPPLRQQNAFPSDVQKTWKTQKTQTGKTQHRREKCNAYTSAQLWLDVSLYVANEQRTKILKISKKALVFK